MNCQRCGIELPEGARFCHYCGKRVSTTPPRPRGSKKRPNGTGSVYKVEGRKLSKPWRARMHGVDIGYYSTKKEAYDALARLTDNDVTERYNWTFEQVYKAWRAAHYADIGDSTKAQYDRAYDLAEDLHKLKFRQLRSDDFQAVLDRNAEKSVSTVQKYKQLFTQMSDWAIQNDIVIRNYAAACEARGRESAHHEPLTEAEIKLIQADGSEAAKVVVCLLSTGMRIGELFKLPLADYHETYVVGGEKSANGRERIIPIRPEGRAAFAAFAAEAEAKGAKLLIGGYRGNQNADNFRKRDYKPLMERLGIDPAKTPHSTRTTYGTRAATDEGLAPAVLQKVMGHAKFDTTQKYYNRPDADALVAAVTDSSKVGKKMG